MKFLRRLLQLTRARLCSVLCVDRFFNLDASREIDRLVVENENLKVKLNAAERGD